jgi:hypothetical protein
MKTVISAFSGLILLIGAVGSANAAACAAGRYRAGCVGAHGAFGVHRGVAGYGYHGGGAWMRPYGYGAACFWRDGVRICR